MIQKEPFFDENISTTPRFALSAEAFKISPSTNYPLMVSVLPPLALKAVRRPSREPYYQLDTRFSRSTSSSLLSHAKFSDIFDYRYLDQLRLEDNENALVFDSDSDYEDVHTIYDVPDKQSLKSSPTGNLGKISGSKKNNINDEKDEYEDDSDLEDYLVHMLTFKVNSRAQYTRPPRTSCSLASDYFDKPVSRADSDLPKTGQHPKFSAPKCKNTFVDSFLPLPELDLEAYLNTCSNGFYGPKWPAKIPAKIPKNSVVNDAYDANERKRGLRDDFEAPAPIPII